MKRIVISTFGSFGDVHPYVALALELKRRGHRPVVATSGVYREKMEAVGLELHPVRPDLPSHEQPDEVSRMVVDFIDRRRGTERIFRWIASHLRDAYDDTLAAAGGADLLLTHPLPFVGPLVAEKTGVLWVSSVLAPLSFFSAYDLPVVPQFPALHGLLSRSRALSRVFVGLVHAHGRRLVAPVERLRAEVGLPRGGNAIFEGQHSPTLVLALFSKILGEPQPDWPPQARVTGFCFYDRRDFAGDSGPPAPELLNFLDAGPPPVVFTLGSSAFWAAENFYRDSLAACRALGRRALLLIGDARNRPSDLPGWAAAFDYAPYGEVLPRAAAVVHHGGVGTTGQALRAGRPQLVVPFSHDQFDNAMRAGRAGCARTLPRDKYDARGAERELRRLLENPSYAERAAAAARVVRGEDGVKTACDLIEEVLGR
ncbi:MAG TPA: nucleotide disphospho-sugar-binding domain-containing protein [Pyrinomonadaceae bacterium]|nr:nucleotide disphospho-sugar-binding domain-containing protein [Pyrinomonadaceae bacterium]